MVVTVVVDVVVVLVVGGVVDVLVVVDVADVVLIRLHDRVHVNTPFEFSTMHPCVAFDVSEIDA